MTVKRENQVLEGEIVEILPNTMFKVVLEGDRKIIGVPSGKMRRGYMRLMPGQRILVEMTPYDEHRGRIIAKA